MKKVNRIILTNLPVTFLILCACLFPPPPSLLLLPPRWPLLRVHALVPPQVAQGAAGIAALVAAVRLLAGVRAGVALQVDQLRRGVRADGAAVRLVAVVRPHVALQVVGVARGEGAQRARVELCMQQVAGRARLPRTPPLALRVADGSIFGVGALQLRGVDGCFLLEALLAAQTIKLRAQVQANSCDTSYQRSESRMKNVNKVFLTTLIKEQQACALLTFHNAKSS